MQIDLFGSDEEIRMRETWDLACLRTRWNIKQDSAIRKKQPTTMLD